MDKRLQVLIAVHLALAAAPLGSLLLEPSTHWLPLLWTLASIPFGSLLVTAFWFGMGSPWWVWRTLLGLAAVGYVGGWQLATRVLESQRYGTGELTDWKNWISLYASITAQLALIVLLFGAALAAIRRRWKLALVIQAPPAALGQRWQFSILSILMLMTGVAVMFTLVGASRAGVTGGMWPTAAIYLLGFGIFFCNMLYSAVAVLRPGPIRLRVALAIVVALLLGTAISIASKHDAIAWWFVAAGTIVGLVPALTVIASLLVVRSIGYRLISLRTPPAASRLAERLPSQ